MLPTGWLTPFAFLKLDFIICVFLLHRVKGHCSPLKVGERQRRRSNLNRRLMLSLYILGFPSNLELMRWHRDSKCAQSGLGTWTNKTCAWKARNFVISRTFIRICNHKYVRQCWTVRLNIMCIMFWKYKFSPRKMCILVHFYALPLHPIWVIIIFDQFRSIAFNFTPSWGVMPCNHSSPVILMTLIHIYLGNGWWCVRKCWFRQYQFYLVTTMSSQTGFAEAGAVKVLFCVNGCDLGSMIRLNW